MCYTSGTTGNPKGVVYSHRSSVLHCMSSMFADTLAVSEADVILPVVPMFHANAWGLAQAGVLAGSTFVMPGPDLSPKAIAGPDGVREGDVRRRRADDLDGRAGRARRARPVVADADPVRRLGGPEVALGGLPREDRRADDAGLGHDRDQPARLGELHQERRCATAPRRSSPDLRALQGIPSPLVEIRIADPDTDEAQPWDGESRGEVQCAGPWIAAGYYGGDGEQQFTDDGWLRTGDVGVITPEGYVKLVDRTKDLVKSGGEWISSVELENEIMAHPQVKEAAVIGIRDEKWGERPLACVVPEDGAELDADDIRGFLDGRVAKWWIPESFEFIDEVPKTSVGKFSKKTLREQFSEVAT